MLKKGSSALKAAYLGSVIISLQRLPFGRIIDERFNVSLQEVRGDCGHVIRLFCRRLVQAINARGSAYCNKNRFAQAITVNIAPGANYPGDHASPVSTQSLVVPTVSAMLPQC